MKVGYVEFLHFDFYVHIFKSTEYSGELKANDEEVSAFWQDMENIPYEEMREADRNFIPDILAGKYVNRRYRYNDNFKLLGVDELAY